MAIQTEKMVTVGGLASGIAHEINNPLAVVVQGAQNALMLMDPAHQRNIEWSAAQNIDFAGIESYLSGRGVIQMVRKIRDSGQRAAGIVQNMLQFSRGVLSEQSPTNLADVLDRAVELTGDECDTKKQFNFGNIKINRQYDPDLPEMICAKTEIQQVIVNMLINAVHSLHGPELGANPTITLRTMQQDRWVRIEIEDNGSGMPEDVRKRIFEPFFTTKDVGEGTGLGLFVAYFIITSKHHGTIDVQSEPGQGAKFTICLPRKTESNRSTMRTSEDDV